MGLEEIVSKRMDAPYRSGPSRAWLKVKNPARPGVRGEVALALHLGLFMVSPVICSSCCCVHQMENRMKASRTMLKMTVAIPASKGQRLFAVRLVKSQGISQFAGQARDRSRLSYP